MTIPTATDFPIGTKVRVLEGNGYDRPLDAFPDAEPFAGKTGTVVQPEHGACLDYVYVSFDGTELTPFAGGWALAPTEIEKLS